MAETKGRRLLRIAGVLTTQGLAHVLKKQHTFKAQILSPEADKRADASLRALAGFLKGHPRGAAGQPAETREAQGRWGKQDRP